MRADGEVLILEDDPETLEELRQHFARKRFHPLVARSASGAMATLRRGVPSGHPILAIIDWDLSIAPDQSLASSHVLAVLGRDFPDCLVLVYTANADFFQVRSGIQRSHPRAWLHDKREGGASLMQRVDRLLDRSVADLRVVNGSLLIHVPTQAEYHHRDAVRLTVRQPEVVTFTSDTATRAVRRFGAWLRRQGSSATVVSHGNRMYRLAVKAPDATRSEAPSPR